MKKKGLAAIGIIGVIAVIAIILVGYFVGTHNSIVSLELGVDEKASEIKTQLQRRADLIPNYVSTVKGYMQHEQNIMDSITDARKSISGANTVEELSAASDKLDAAIKNFNIVIENYPDLKSSQNFISLQDELAGTENRIATARRDYNEAVKTYNTKVSTIPSSIVAGMMGKQKKDFFDVTDESKKEVPQVDFSDNSSNQWKDLPV